MRPPPEDGEDALSGEDELPPPRLTLELTERVVREEGLLEPALELLKGGSRRRRHHPVDLRGGYLHTREVVVMNAGIRVLVAGIIGWLH